MRWVAYMPLRGGSKSIPGKNIRPLAGNPLFAWSLQAAIDSGCFDEVWVGTDDTAIRAAVEARFPGQVHLFERSPETCSDEASTESAMLEFAREVEFDVICLVQATSPMTLAADFVAAREQFLTHNADSLLTATQTKRFFWTPSGEPLNYDPAARPRRQDFAGSLIENGAFYFTRRAVLEQQRCRLGGSISVFEMPEVSALEIDEPGDWAQAEALLEQRQPDDAEERIRYIQALVIDVDGTLTDGGMYYGPIGEALKKFNTRDAMGLQRIRQAGIRLCVMTQEQSEAVHARMRKLKIDNYHPGVTDKLTRLHQIAKDWDLPLEAIAYMGDDLNDLACLKTAGYTFCPQDAVPEITTVADHVTSHHAGSGAVREACDLLLARTLLGIKFSHKADAHAKAQRQADN
jgi:YrbI family 3-deoxy-D-manno-octulosonate 8-phosphate phosphatase